MKLFSYIALGGILFIHLAVAQENNEQKIPPAFPENSTSSHPLESHTTLPPPIAVPPGKSKTTTSVSAKPDTLSSNADWVLRRMATSEDAATRRRASEAWPMTNSFMITMDTLVYALADPDEKVRTTAVDRLYRMEPTQVFAYVMRTLVNGTLGRSRALESALPDLEAILVPLMLETLRTEIETSLHRRIAAYCLGRMHALTAIETLGHYTASTDITLVRACADALYAIGTAQAVPYWMILIDHHDLYCRRLAIHGLAFTGGPNAFERLKLFVLHQGESLTLQTEALQALSSHPPLLLYPLLVDILELNPQLYSAALYLLRKQAGVDFGKNRKEWRNWLNTLTAKPPPPILPGK